MRSSQRIALAHANRVAACVMVAILGLGAVACRTTVPKEFTGPTPGYTFGAILVGSPEVYGRERLVQDRQQHKEWLKLQLAIADTEFDSFEALVQRRASSSQSFSLNVDASATGRDAVDQLNAAADQRDRTNELAELQHQIEIAKLQQQLEAIRAGTTVAPASPGASGTTTTTTGGTANTSTPTGSSTTSTATASTGGTSTGSGTAGTTTAAASSTSGSNGLPAIAIASSTAKDSPITRFRRKDAFRGLVRQELLENDLDDAHDLDGNTLYRLTFDTTVLPENDTSAWAVVQVEFDPKSFKCDPATASDQTKRELDEIKNQWLKSLREYLEQEASDLSRDLVEEGLRPEVRELLMMSDQRSQLVQDWKDARGVRDREVDVMARAEEEARETLAEYYTKNLRIKDQALEIQFDRNAETLKVTLDQAGELEAFCKIVTSLASRVEPYAVTPKETIQRVAESSLSQSEKDLALGLALTLGSVGLDQALDASRIDDFQQQSIRRQPLVVGFADGTASGNPKIGWVIGPRFLARQSGFDFRHTLVQEPLSALVSIPAWWTSASITVKTCWIPEEKTDEKYNPWIKNENICNPSAKEKTYPIRLPGDPEEITRALIPRSRRPQPLFYGTPRMQIGRADSILIYGANLWRNPVVFVGSQRADAVDVLPNMEGIVATFSKVVQPASWSASDGKESVTVWTSEGVGFAGLVQLIEAPKDATTASPKPLFQVKTSIQTVIAQQGKATLDVAVKFESATVSKVFLEVTGAEFDAAVASATPATCLSKAKLNLWEVTADCQIQMALKNLPIGESFILKSYRLEGEKKVPHPDITIEIRRR